MQAGPPNPYAQPAPPPKKSSSCLIIGIIVAVIGGLLVLVIAPLAIYSVRRYLASAKTAEAKNTIGAIARAARQSYEREQVAPDDVLVAAGATSTHAFCRSANPVPAAVPKGLKYQPGSGPGVDFDAGDATTGWKCLKFSMTQPIYYQYHYRQGSGYVSPTAPGPNGFEAAARGDLDGDGSQSTFALTGDASGGVVQLSTQIYIEEEFE